MEEPNQIALVLNVRPDVGQEEVYSLLESIIPELLPILKENKFPFPEDATDDDDMAWIDDRYADWIEPEDSEDSEEGEGDFD